MERRANKKKLSKHLLEMKFMKRTREKTEIQVHPFTTVCEEYIIMGGWLGPVRTAPKLLKAVD